MELHEKIYKIVPIIGTIMRSKEDIILNLFFNNPTKEWRFKELILETRIARSKLDGWLKKFRKSKIIKRVKETGKMPHYISNYSSEEYRNRKRVFGINKLYESGLVNHLTGLNARTVIIFGSLSRSDWHAESDIDIFIYGDIEGLKISTYELKLGREIQIFHCETKKT